jgi:hypothetical protein
LCCFVLSGGGFNVEDGIDEEVEEDEEKGRL